MSRFKGAHVSIFDSDGRLPRKKSKKRIGSIEPGHLSFAMLDDKICLFDITVCSKTPPPDRDKVFLPAHWGMLHKYA